MAKHAAIALDALVDLVGADPNPVTTRRAPLLPLVGCRWNSNHAGQALGHVFVDLFFSFARDIDREATFEVVPDKSSPSTSFILFGVVMRICPGFFAVECITELGCFTCVDTLVPSREVAIDPHTDFVASGDATQGAD